MSLFFWAIQVAYFELEREKINLCEQENKQQNT